ncbi:pentatricopeptide repeat-containing protein At2g41720 isoform X2 [Ananas comosus]|uniref:Pentatricopeptide repeat-containing protein At2g41720 isoform X2 n=1 Tax=Ananas comosus TaxID=4615 RepID=A0A6P5G4V6_ANACO|nr:pentatricopeptide repeat-containing protein At2g41720 isoform X2 [Ananas comosus]
MAMVSSSSSTPQNPSPLQKPNSPTPPTPPLRIRAPSRKPKSPPHPPPWAERKLVGSVDYDEGRRRVSGEVAGVRKDGIPARHRLRVEGSRWQRDWKVSEVAERVLGLDHWEDVDGVLNCWAGRFARRNFPLLIREITNAGSLEHAVHVFCWMKNQKNYCAHTDMYNMMIRLHARHNRIDQARGLFFEMQEWRCKPDAETFNALIHTHARAGQWRWATNIMEDMLRAAIPPSRTTYNNLINACGSSGNWKKALEISKKMTENGVGPDLVTHNIVLSAFKNGAQYSKALAYFELMKETNISPDIFTHNIVIYCLVKLGQFGTAVDMFNSMKEKSSECRPDIVTYTTIMRAYSVCGQTENCKAVFDMMAAEGLKPNIVSYNALLSAYSSNGMHVEALAIFKSIKRDGLRPDIVSYTSLLNAYGRSSQPEKAREIFDTMKRHNWKPNRVSYNALIDAYGSVGMLAEAVKVLHEMERDEIHPDIVSISTLLAACGRCGQIVKIDSILSAAKSRGIVLNTVAYNSAIGSYMSVGEYDKALKLYKLMKENNAKPDSVTFNILISGSCKVGKFTESLKLLDEMTELQIPLSKEVYSSLICVYSKQGQLVEAESIFNRMREAGCFPDVITYTAMIHAYSIAENWKRAWDLFQDMAGRGIEPDPIACSSLMEVLNRGCQPEMVIQLVELMREKHIPLNPSASYEIIFSCSMLRDWRTAIQVIEHMEPSFSSTSLGILNQLLHFLGKCGKIETMMKIFFKILASCSNVGCATYSILLKNLLAAGKWRKYIEVLQWMEDAGIQPAAYMYRNVISYAWKENSMEYVALIQEKIKRYGGCMVEEQIATIYTLYGSKVCYLTLNYFLFQKAVQLEPNSSVGELIEYLANNRRCSLKKLHKYYSVLSNRSMNRTYYKVRRENQYFLRLLPISVDLLKLKSHVVQGSLREKIR